MKIPGKTGKVKGTYPESADKVLGENWESTGKVLRKYHKGTIKPQKRAGKVYYLKPKVADLFILQFFVK